MAIAPVAYTIRTAAEATGLSASTIRRATDSGDLAYTQPAIDGKAVRGRLIDPDELKRWVTTQAA